MRLEEDQGDWTLIRSRVKDLCQSLAFPGTVRDSRFTPYGLGGPFPQPGRRGGGLFPTPPARPASLQGTSDPNSSC